MDRHQIFPTFMYTSTNFLNNSLFQQLKKSITSDKNAINDDDLLLYLEEKIQFILDDLEIGSNNYKIDITEIWGNILAPGEDHPYHTHPNNVFSGILYLTEGTPTTFLDPRPQNNLWQFSQQSSQQNNQIGLEAIPNMLVVFPSWLAHFVPVNKNNTVRKTISFNVLLRGKFGANNSLCEVII